MSILKNTFNFCISPISYHVHILSMHTPLINYFERVVYHVHVLVSHTGTIYVPCNMETQMFVRYVRLLVDVCYFRLHMHKKKKIKPFRNLVI